MKPLSPAAAGFLRHHFAAHYRDHPPALPDRAARRELGLRCWRPDGTLYLQRHLTARHPAQLAQLLAAAPHSALCSVAYYRQPSIPHMDRKGWLGATLVFDVDADHLRTIQARMLDGPVPLDEQLRQAKGAAKRIADDFLLDDLGIAVHHVRLAFSGGRGYHVRVSDPKVLAADSRMRREICNYVTGKGLEPARAASGPHFARGGWPRRLSAALAHHEDGESPGEQQTRLAAAVQALAGETDEPVTMDVTRLLRLPGSLHGGTGLLCTAVRLDELDDFEPLRDAVAFRGKAVAVRAIRDADARLEGQGIHLRAGDEAPVPLSHAVFLVARGLAEPVDKTPP